jgi:hypothetical protein
MNRPQLPSEVRRAVLVEAGHRCAIPTCPALHPKVHHIKPVCEGGRDDFDNLIALCANCHDMAHRGEIDRKAMRQYKANLSVIDNRYSSMERRVLEYFADGPSHIDLPPGFEILLWYLVEDGYLTKPVDQRDINARRFTRTHGIHMLGSSYRDVLDRTPHVFRYSLTKEGREFIEAWARADDIE